MNLKDAIFKVKCGEKDGTAFLIGENTAITSFHVVREYSDTCNITLSNEKNKNINASVSTLTTEHYKSMDIALLNLVGLTEKIEFIQLAISDTFPKMTKWSSRGFLAAKGEDGLDIHPIGNTIINSYYDNLTEDRTKYDIDLSVDYKWDSFKGMSGSPLIISDYAYGVITTEILQNGSAKELCALSTKKFISLLEQANINVLHHNLSNDDKELDKSGTEGYGGISTGDSRSLSEKLTSVCSSIRKARLEQYGREAINSNLELSGFPDSQVSSFKYRIFEACQRKLLDLVEGGLEAELDIIQIKSILDQFVDEAYLVINERSSDYRYPVTNKDSIRNAVLALIDECYLAFDEDGLYE